MVSFSEEKISEVKQAVDLTELVSQYVNLKRSGGGTYMGLCPFHSEKTPSFTVNPQRGFFHCFGCGVGGDAIHFLMKIAELSFPEAVSELARRYGVELPEPGSYRGSSTPAVNKSGIYEVLKAAQDYFSSTLWSEAGVQGRRYLAQRGLQGSAARQFSLGLAPDRWDGLAKYLSGRGFGSSLAQEAGLIKNNREGGFYDTFRNRLMIPILDAEGRVAAFGGRFLGQDKSQPKYLNSPETAVYKKGRLLYGYHRARPFLRSAGMVFLVEGYFDLISLAAAGINEVVATLGTALTSGQLNLLKGHVREVALLFDGDEAGQRAAARTLPLLLNAELDGLVLRLPPGHDPDSFVRELGPEALYEAAGQAVDIVDFVVGRLKKAHPNTPAGEARLLRDARELLAQVSDSAKSRLLRRRLARLLDLEEELLGDLKRQALRPLARQSSPAAAPSFDKVALELLTFIVSHPETAPEALESLAAYWPQDATRPVFERLRARWERAGAIKAADALGDDPEEITAALSRAAASERLWPVEDSGPIIRQYVGRMMDKWRKRRELELSEALAQAERRGDSQEAARLLREKLSLQNRKMVV